MEAAMLHVYLIDQLVLRLIEGVANRLLRLAGGPHHVPRRNDDFVWY
jgi:hypothetical protein